MEARFRLFLGARDTKRVGTGNGYKVCVCNVLEN